MCLILYWWTRKCIRQQVEDLRTIQKAQEEHEEVASGLLQPSPQSGAAPALELISPRHGWQGMKNPEDDDL